MTYIYKYILKPIWTYDIQLWGTVSNSNIEILSRFKSASTLTDVQWLVINIQHNIHKNFNIATEKNNHIQKYSDCLSSYPNDLAKTLMTNRSLIKRLKRKISQDLIAV